MKVIKKINNNVAVCIDSNNIELIAYGKGIGFPDMPYELEDLSMVDRTFYDLDQYSFKMFNEISEELLNITVSIVDKAKNYLNTSFSSSFVLTLADHFQFAIKRNQENIIIQNPLVYDLKHLYSDEYKLAQWARRFVRQQLSINLPVEEEFNIAMHFINGQLDFTLEEKQVDSVRIVEEITFIIEKHLNTVIDREDFNYARFNSHIQYLLKRKSNNQLINTKNINIYKQLRKDFPEVYQCVLEISDYFSNNLMWEPNDDENMYLMLHVNRLYNRNGL